MQVCRQPLYSPVHIGATDVGTLGGFGATRSVGSACAGRIVPGFVPSLRCPLPAAKRKGRPSGTVPVPGTGLPLTPRWRRRWRKQKPWLPSASPGLFLVPEYKEEKYSDTLRGERPSPHTCKQHHWLHTGLHGWREGQRVPLGHYQHLQGDVLLQRLPMPRGFS